ncbi:MAG: branched-chain amino acid ABC transporter substrate-binding protein [Oscillospiraceae bacterium]|jgi:branched-chain amino acid transport system substrate-binding protein|nr:branched-chain amino acid ABC transporter substrate-binding protein [Oscillospiraceae bacterium]
MRKHAIRYIAVLAALTLLSSVFAGCGKTSGGTEAEKPITIGVLVPLSGSEAYYGNDMLQSYKLACDEINAAGGVLGRKLALYEADDGCDPNMATQAASKIIAKGVDFVVGGYGSGATIPTLQLFYDEDLLMLVSCANSTDITKLGLNQTFMINSPGTHAVITLTELCKSLGTKKVALIHQGDAYTKNLSDICEKELPKSDIAIAKVQVMEKNTPDVSAIVTAIRNSGADFVYWCGYHADGSNVIKQLRRGGYQGNIAVGDGSASVELISACGSDGEGVYVTSPPFVEFAQGGEKFVADYKAKFNMAPGTYATLCYDTIYLLKEAIEQAGTTETASVRDAVQGAAYQGLSGMIKFTPEREPAVSNFIILQIKDGKFDLVTL